MALFFTQKTAYVMRISYWSSDVGSSDLAFYDVGFPVPSTPQGIALSLYAPAEAIFERLMGKRPFPIMRFIAQWLRRNVPQDRTRATFVNFDAGQFLYEDDRVTGLIDFEVSSFGDPAAELSGLRLRDEIGRAHV